ncbi:phosphotransferase [Thermobifida halotolerans]|uniref:Phosphotransferase n=1 Tax=Thermobifida halotolerans TaxID=483545 RepID=A0AA97M0Z3_9ACTN|nr:phosphotransferase [Thermobifida halotolerans]
MVHALPRFGIDPVAVEHAPVGFGDHHWTVTGADGRRWFATVSDLEHKEHCGKGAQAALAGLRRAMDTAAALREDEALDFVVAPVRATDGATVLPLDGRYALSVFPLVAGRSGEFGQELPAEQREQVLDLLAELHGSAPPSTVPAIAPAPPGHGRLAAVLSEPPAGWRGGPFADPARRLLTGNAAALRARIAEFDRLAEEVGGRGTEPVVTHGEPHPGNLLFGAEGCLLVDWDTVGLAPPERDLSVLSTDPAALTRYTERTGHVPDPAALALYTLRWELADAAELLGRLSAPHARTPGIETVWREFVGVIGRLANPELRP